MDPKTTALWKWNVVCQTICLFFASTMFIMRTYVRAYLKRAWILEDYLCCCAFAGLVSYSGIVTATIYKGGGFHEWDLTTPQVQRILYYVNVGQIIYGLAAAATKSAILLLYLRILSPRRWGTLDIVIRAFMLIVCLFYLTSTISKIIQCIPRARIWDAAVPGSCIDRAILLDVSGAFNVLSDVIILLLPLKNLWSLHMSRKWKPAIYLVVLVGAIAPVFSVIGFVQRFRLSSSPDQSYNQVVIYLWATAELAVGVMVICFPSMPHISNWRAKRPSKSAFHGTFRSPNANGYLLGGQRSIHTQNSLDEGDYMELSEVRPRALRKNVLPQAVIQCEILGGTDLGGKGLGSNSGERTLPDGILRSIGIEQSKG